MTVDPAKERKKEIDLAAYVLPDFTHYPDSDGEPMADNDDQYEAITDAQFALESHFRDEPMVYVTADLLIYYKKGDPTKRVAPDVFVVKGAAKRNRRSYRLWIERQAPDVVFEVASPGTWQRDVEKAELYFTLGIPEYIMFDPSGGDYFGQILSGLRANDDGYEPIPLLPAASEPEMALFSEQLGLEVWARPGKTGQSPYVIRFRDPQTGEWLLSPAEADTARRKAEARLAELEAELARLRADSTDR